MLLVVAAAALSAFIALIWLGYRRRWQWTGLPAGPAGERSTRTPKTLWDWLQLLVVPLVLAVAAFLFNQSQATRDLEQQQRQDKRDRNFAMERTRDEALRSYLRQMSALVMHEDLRDADVVGALPSRPSDAQTLARTVTLVALRQLDGDRKAIVLQFLWEAGLISQTQSWIKIGTSGWGFEFRKKVPLVSLQGADLRGVDLAGVRLAAYGAPANTTISSDPLRGTSHQFREGIDFTGADLKGADFSGSNLSNAIFVEADLRGADFDDSVATSAVFDQACLTGASFRGAVLAGVEVAPEAQFDDAGGHGIDFTGADLDGVNMQSSQLTSLRLRDASIRETSFPLQLEGGGIPEDPFARPNRCNPETSP